MLIQDDQLILVVNWDLVFLLQFQVVFHLLNILMLQQILL